MGDEGGLGLPALAPRPDRRATSRSTSSPARSSPAQGSTWQNPPASFYRTNRDPMTAAETVGQVFLGVRLQCARCHNHPFDVWTQDDYYGLAAYFGNVAPQGGQQRPHATSSTSTRSTATRSSTSTGRPGWSSPGPARRWRPKPPRRPAPDARRRPRRARRPGRLADPRQPASSPGTWPTASGST